MNTVQTAAWVHRSDIVKRIPGREDPPDLAENCWGYLTKNHLVEQQAVSQAAARKAAPALVAAKVRLATIRATQSEVERKLAERDAVISRLLAFVPTRAKPIDPARLELIVARLMHRAAKLFPESRQIRASTHEETDEDTEACESIVMTIAQDTEADPEAFVAAVSSLHRFLAEDLSSEEYKAVNLVVEPDFSEAG